MASPSSSRTSSQTLYGAKRLRRLPSSSTSSPQCAYIRRVCLPKIYFTSQSWPHLVCLPTYTHEYDSFGRECSHFGMKGGALRRDSSGERNARRRVEEDTVASLLYLLVCSRLAHLSNRDSVRYVRRVRGFYASKVRLMNRRVEKYLVPADQRRIIS